MTDFVSYVIVKAEMPDFEEGWPHVCQNHHAQAQPEETAAAQELGTAAAHTGASDCCSTGTGDSAAALELGTTTAQ